MYLRSLRLTNIGPFRSAELEMPASGEAPVPVVITGDNGSGKSVLIDAVRAALTGEPQRRNLVRAGARSFSIDIEAEIDGKQRHLHTSSARDGVIECADPVIAQACRDDGAPGTGPWIFAYWGSDSASDTLTSLSSPLDPGRHSDFIQRIINRCLEPGAELRPGATSAMPIVVQNGLELPLNALSAGTLYLIERLSAIAAKMLAASERTSMTVSPANIPGILLIDEIEAHLHPKRQKEMLSLIRDAFPRLQVILTTHSPHVVGSLEHVKVYTCETHDGFSTVQDCTQPYSSMPVEEVLLSDVFGAVSKFSPRITALLAERKKLAEAGLIPQARAIERELYDINPDYFFLFSPRRP